MERPNILPEERAEQLVSACRTAAGDELRTVVYFTPDDHEFLYVRSDLREHEDRARELAAEFVENERLGFSTRETYNRLADGTGVEPEIGEYEFTVRVFSDGFVSRVILGDGGVILTTDGMDIRAFEDLAATVRQVLAE